MQPEIESDRTVTKVWGGWQTIGFGLAIFAVYLVVQSLIAIIFFIGRYLSEPVTDLTQLLANLSTDGLLVSITVIVSAVAGIAMILLFIKIRKGATIKEYLGLNPISKKTILINLAIVIGLIAVSSFLGPVFDASKDTAFMIDAYKTSIWPALLGVAVVIFAPLFEEVFFRGFLFLGLERSRLGSFGTIVLTAVAWALLHLQYDVFGMATILILGLVFGIVRLRTGSLWSTLLLHSIWNLVAIVGTALYINGVGS